MAGKKGAEKGRYGEHYYISPRLCTGCAAAVAVMGLWHVMDVRAGAAKSGDGWLFGWYAALLVFSAILMAGLWYGLRGKGGWKPERIFAGSVMGLGLMYLFVLPPLSAPDEVSHFISAYQLSNHLLGQEANAPDGRVYIRSQDAFIEDMLDVMEDAGSGRREEAAMQSATPGQDTAVVLGQELTESTYGFIKERGFGGASNDGTAVSYQPPVRTTPLAYMPQALGLMLARLVGLGGLGLLYMGRLVNLLFFTAMGYFTVKRMPFGKEVVMGAALLPMTLHLAASFSYDVMILSMSGYFIAVCLDLAYRAEKVGVRDIVSLTAVMAVMGPCKMVYGVIAGFCLLIPVRKFGAKHGGWPVWALSAAAVLGAFGGAMMLVNSQTVAMYTEASEGYVAWAGEAGYTFTQLIHSPVLVFRMCYNTLMWQGEQLYTGMLGSALGNMDQVLNTPYVIILGLTVILVMLALRKPGESIHMSMKNRIWIWFLCIICLGALMFSMLLAWTPVTSNVINGVQGRYLLPLLPIFLLTLKNDKVVRTDCNDRGLIYILVSMDIYVVLRIFSIVCLRV